MKKSLMFLLIPIVVLIVGVGAYVYVSATPSNSINLSDYFSVSYDGFNSMATLDVVRNLDFLFDDVDKIRIAQKDSLFKNKDIKNDDYMNFAAGIEIIPDKMENLSNGDVINCEYLYDKELARKLKISVKGEPFTVEVSNLKDAVVLTSDDLFKDLTVSFSGTSPNVTMEIANNSTNEFIKGLVYNPLEYKEEYSTGDEVLIRCYYDNTKALSDTYYISEPSESCVRKYVVEGVDSYVSDLSQIPDSIITEAIKTGKSAFVDANEYGVRIFCEANLVPVYINKKATFRYLEPRLISAYFKTAHEAAAGKDGNHYNDLDLIYSVDITQADGVTCNCEAVVRFSEFVLQSDGNVLYDFSNPKIISASYQNSAIVKNVVTKYEDTYDIEKLDLSKY